MPAVPLPGYILRNDEIAQPFEDADDLRGAFGLSIKIRVRLRAGMIAGHQEIDWLVREGYGLIEKAQTLTAEFDLSLDREQGLFCIWQKAGGDFNKAVSFMPQNWSDEKKALWRQRVPMRENVGSSFFSGIL